MSGEREPEVDLLARVRAAMAQGSDPTRSMTAGMEQLFVDHQASVLRLCRKMLANEETAREVAQEAMLVAYQRLPSFEGGSSFGTWLYGIARNLCLNHVRKRTELLAEDGLLDPLDPSTPALAALTRTEREEVLRVASEVLAPEEQEAVYLRYVEGIPWDNIEEMLGLQAGAARVILQRSRRRLRRRILEQLQALGHGSSFLHTRS